MIIFPTSSNNVEVLDDPLVWVVFVLPISKLNLNITFLVVPQKLAENILFLVNKKSPLALDVTVKASFCMRLCTPSVSGTSNPALTEISICPCNGKISNQV